MPLKGLLVVVTISSKFVSSWRHLLSSSDDTRSDRGRDHCPPCRCPIQTVSGAPPWCPPWWKEKYSLCCRNSAFSLGPSPRSTACRFPFHGLCLSWSEPRCFLAWDVSSSSSFVTFSSPPTSPHKNFYLNLNSPYWSHKQLGKYLVYPCRASHARGRFKYSRRCSSFLETPWKTPLLGAMQPSAR